MIDDKTVAAAAENIKEKYAKEWIIKNEYPINKINAFFIGVLLGMILMLVLISYFKTDNIKIELDTVKAQNEFYKKELESWKDHSIRMKRIVGIPDTIKWTDKIKKEHPINATKLNSKKLK
mgnify:CR=1 FL=1